MEWFISITNIEKGRLRKLIIGFYKLNLDSAVSTQQVNKYH